MTTYPQYRDNGSLHSFEISNSFPWSWGPMRKVLESVEGVADFRRARSNDDRFTFTFRGRPCVVNEPFGDNSRYWIGPVNLEPPLDMEPVHSAFRAYRFWFTFDSEFKR